MLIVTLIKNSIIVCDFICASQRNLRHLLERFSVNANLDKVDGQWARVNLVFVLANCLSNDRLNPVRSLVLSLDASTCMECTYKEEQQSSHNFKNEKSELLNGKMELRPAGPKTLNIECMNFLQEISGSMLLAYEYSPRSLESVLVPAEQPVRKRHGYPILKIQHPPTQSFQQPRCPIVYSSKSTMPYVWLFIRAQSRS